MSEQQKTVLFYVQHLLGIGHVFRATRVARALARAGFRVHVAWGGCKIPSIDLTGLDMTFLPPARVADEDFKTLLHEDFTPFSDQDKDARRDQLLALFNEVKPDIVITEAFPFGRRLMRFELVPLMQAAREASWKPLKVASIRDIMQENRAEKRVRETLDHVHNDYDIVLVHGDPALIPIEATLQGADEIADKIRYTGLVTPDATALNKDGYSPDVLVSVGGGAVGRNLALTAAKAMPLSKELPNNWLVTRGPDMPQAVCQQLDEARPEGMEIVDFIPDLVSTMARARVSVSLSGYNTVGDQLRAKTRSVLVPFAEGLETEQLRRASMMQQLGLAIMIKPEDLSSASLARAVDEAAKLKPAEISLDMEGADNSAHILARELEEKRKTAGS